MEAKDRPELREKIKEVLFDEQCHLSCSILEDDNVEVIAGVAKKIYEEILPLIPDILQEGRKEVVDMFQVATTVPTSLPNTVWFSVTHDSYKKLFPDGKLLRV